MPQGPQFTCPVGDSSLRPPMDRQGCGLQGVGAMPEVCDSYRHVPQGDGRPVRLPLVINPPPSRSHALLGCRLGLGLGNGLGLGLRLGWGLGLGLRLWLLGLPVYPSRTGLPTPMHLRASTAGVRRVPRRIICAARGEGRVRCLGPHCPEPPPPPLYGGGWRCQLRSLLYYHTGHCLQCCCR